MKRPNVLYAHSFALASLVIASVLLLNSCSSTQQKPGGPQSAGQSTDSTVTIHYVLGHSRHQIVMHSEGSNATAECRLDDKQLKSVRIDLSHYSNFFKQADNFIGHQKTAQLNHATRIPAECASPYTVEIKNGNQINKVEGCRVQDPGAFAHLVQDAEFIVYSQK